MIIVVSPAKNLDYETPLPTNKYSQPELLEESKILADICKTLTPLDLSNLMKISDKLAGLNAARFTEWQPNFNLENARQAIYAFNGDVYTGLDAYTLSDRDIDYAQNNLRILSGLYGLLKPLDLMQAYRLEMGTKLENPRGKNLYDFWGDIITQELNKSIASQQSNTLINLASNEYFKSVKKNSLSASIVTPEFRDWKNGQFKMISFFAKKARGLMARFIIQNKISNVADLKLFDAEGYTFNPALSTADKPVFTRKLD
ncbi:peroxide stress protein YaaA [Catenovulum sediminis]|uniref:UPF0246 protein ABS311_17845 n=1 Tax=Catenovulum sediminis TaxID=1740262 RepID=A0ABV1RLB9_9ALTE|nr:peroxide stress protein YaaA [Catenovulum sediminis]